MNTSDLWQMFLFSLGLPVFLFVLFLIAGLCRAAADLRDVEPDNGEYESYD